MAGDLIAHMEAFLGPIDGGWSEDAAGRRLPFKVLRFINSPIPGATTFATLGVSDVAVSMPDGRLVRQELVFSAYDRYASAAIATALHDVAVDVVSSGRALLRGSVCAGSFEVPGVAHDLYCTMPIFFPEGFQAWRGSDPPTVFVWLVPIAPVERRLVDVTGWEELERLMETQDPDLLDLERPPLRLS